MVRRQRQNLVKLRGYEFEEIVPWADLFGLDDPPAGDPLRWAAGRGSRPCVGCGGHFAPGHAYEHTREGPRHVDCEDTWLGYFEEVDDDV